MFHKTYFDKHLDGKNSCEDIVGTGQEGSFLRVRRYVRPLHSQRDTIQSYEQQNDVVEPSTSDNPCAESSHAVEQRLLSK